MDLLCCCLNKQDLEDGISVNLNCSNACCQKTVTITEKERGRAAEKNLFQRAASSIIRRNQETNKCSASSGSTKGIEMVESTMDLRVAQTNKEKIPLSTIYESRC